MNYKIFYILILFKISLCIKLKILDEDFIKIRIGNPQTELKLLIDPVSPFTYIFKNFKSSTTEKLESTIFQNAFGTYEGEWQNDFFFLTEDPFFNIKLRYVKVLKTKSNFHVDGVFGLGYHSGYPESNIYSVLNKIHSLFNMKKLLSYDKKKKLLTIGEIPLREYSNPVRLPIYHKEGKIETFIKLSSISFMNKNTREIHYEDINDDAVLGLFPILIAPKLRYFWMNNTYIPKIIEFNTSYYILPQKKKFFSDIYIHKINNSVITSIILNKFGYKYKFAEKIDGGYRSLMRLGDDFRNPLPYWYLGIDTLNIDRLDFDFNLYVVRIFSNTAYDIDGNKLLFLFKYILLTIAICVWICIILRVFLAKKKQKDIEKGTELQEL